MTREDAHAEEQGEDNLPNREYIASDNEVQDTGKAAPLLVMEQQPIIAAHTIVTTMPLDTIQPDLPSVTTKTLAHGVLTSSHSTPQAGSTSRELSQEDPADSIEPADDLVGDTTSTQDEDPIEHDSAVEPMLKPPITKAMKGRQGKVSTQSAHLPILASKVVHPVAPQSASPKKGKGHVGDSRVNDPTNTGVTVYPPAPIQSQQRTPVLAPADVVSTTQPKRRGRPPISQEEKERREAVKKAGKEEKAARAIAARAATKAEKGAKKQAENAERTKNNRKASAKPRKSATVVVKVGQVPTPVPTLPSSSLAVAPPPDSQQTVELPKTPFNPPPQVSHDSVKWTVLSQTPDPESSVVDQLRSSSPSVSVDLPPHPPVILPAAKISQRPVKKSIKQNLSPLVPLRPPPSQFVTPLRPNQPLFLPGTQSQFPDTPVGGSVPSSSQRNIFSPSDAEQNERHPQSQPTVRLATWGGNSRFPRLSQLPSQFLFTPSISSTSTPLSTAEQSALNTGDHNNGDDSESSSSDSDSDDSDSDPDENHIPSNRRAGAIPKTAKGSLSGL